MAISRQTVPARPHPVFLGVFAEWQTKAGVLSALPDAPVVPDEPRQPLPVWRWLRSREIDWPRFSRRPSRAARRSPASGPV